MALQGLAHIDGLRLKPMPQVHSVAEKEEANGGRDDDEGPHERRRIRSGRQRALGPLLGLPLPLSSLCLLALHKLDRSWSSNILVCTPQKPCLVVELLCCSDLGVERRTGVHGRPSTVPNLQDA